MTTIARGVAVSAAAAGALAACGPDAPSGSSGSDYEIITVLSKDGIPAIDNPSFWTAAEASEAYADEDLVIGVSLGGEAKAYSLPHLSRHEIVNDTIAGTPISVTW